MRFNVGVAFVAFGLLFGIAGTVVAQQPYPSKPIRFIVPFPPGGSTDPMARLAATRLAERWGHPVVVDNRPGANTVIGADAVAKASPDGYTILLASSSFINTPSLVARLPYDPIKDFAGVATIAKSRLLLIVPAASPVGSFREMVAYAKAKSEQLNQNGYRAARQNHQGGQHQARELRGWLHGLGSMISMPWPRRGGVCRAAIDHNRAALQSAPGFPPRQLRKCTIRREFTRASVVTTPVYDKMPRLHLFSEEAAGQGNIGAPHYTLSGERHGLAVERQDGARHGRKHGYRPRDRTRTGRRRRSRLRGGAAA